MRLDTFQDERVRIIRHPAGVPENYLVEKTCTHLVSEHRECDGKGETQEEHCRISLYGLQTQFQTLLTFHNQLVPSLNQRGRSHLVSAVAEGMSLGEGTAAASEDLPA